MFITHLSHCEPMNSGLLLILSLLKITGVCFYMLSTLLRAPFFKCRKRCRRKEVKRLTCMRMVCSVGRLTGLVVSLRGLDLW